MKPGPYRPSIRRLQEEWAQRLARQRMLERARQGRPPGPKTITDNSVPWLENPNSVADYIEISNRIRESEAAWRSQSGLSSDT